MDTVLLIAGTVFIAAGVLFLLIALLNRHGYKNLVDGTAGHYRRLRRRALVFFIAGIALAVIGAVGVILSKML